MRLTLSLIAALLLGERFGPLDLIGVAVVAGGEVVRISGAPAQVNHRHLCVKGHYAHGVARHPERLSTPMPVLPGGTGVWM